MLVILKVQADIDYDNENSLHDKIEELEALGYAVEVEYEEELHIPYVEVEEELLV